MNTTIHVKLTDETGTRELSARSGQMLHDLLHVHDTHLSAPCGGRGTCGKCAVLVDGIRRLSCKYELTHDVSVEVPRARRATILSAASALKSVANDSGFAPSGNQGEYCYRVCGSEGAVSGAHAGLYGVAIDIGTTTVVVYLENLLTYTTCDIESFLNPQAPFGHDVVSRIHYTMEHADGLRRLSDEIREGMSTAIRELCERNGLDLACVCKATIAGNNTMLHLLLGEDPAPIAQAPYTPRFTQQQLRRAADLGLVMNPDGVVVVLPSVSAYVGADITAGVASTDMLSREDFSLFVDIGTNGEMALGNQERLYCCSTAAGPAFEGATIHHGTGGVDGAVSHVGADGAVETIGNLSAIGICGSGVLDVTAELLRQGLADAGGFMEKEFVVVPQARTATGADIVFVPSDVREVQLASAAIFAGMRIMMKEAGISTDQIGRLYLAGGFGNYLRVESAVAIGLLPMSLQERVIPIGNSAGSGARLALRSMAFTNEVTRVAGIATYVELSMRADFNDEYVMAMMLEGRG